MNVDNILSRILEIEHGFQHILGGADEVFSAYSKEQCFEFALTLFEHEAYQARMLATTILGRLATTNNNALRFLKEQVSTDENWRVQEMLFKGYKQEARRIDTARGGAMGFIQSSNSVHLQTCGKVVKVKTFCDFLLLLCFGRLLVQRQRKEATQISVCVALFY